MKKDWNVKIDDQMYEVKLVNRKISVNGVTLKKDDYRKKTHLITEDYEFSVGSKQALLIIKNLSAPQLIIDGKDCATGEDYVPVKLPKWSYIFIVLHCINFINGLLGVLLAVVGITLTTSISNNRKLNVAVRVILDLAVLVLAIALTFGLAMLVAGI